MKIRTVYRCTSCGHVAPKWLGRCPACGTWETMIEEVDAQPAKGKGRLTRSTLNLVAGAATSLADVQADQAPRIHTGMQELDRVLGGGLVPGSIVLVGGDPGMGKSTLMLQLAAFAGSSIPNRPCLYVTGEESLHQIKQRAERLGVQSDGIVVASETNVERIVALIEHISPSLVVVDSVQTITTDLMESSAGSVAQVRECTSLLTRVAKRSGIPIIIVGHVTKDGLIAGPKVLEHMVDAVLQFEGEGTYSYRVLRALKNRYGSTNEIGVFDMTSSGLREVHNPSEVLLSNRSIDEPGTAVVAVMEGTRPLLIEVQALVSPTGYSVPQRVSTGYDTRRLQMILAVLEKRGGVQVRQSDVFVNVAGGIAVQDPAIDLGVAVAIASSVTDRPIPAGVAFIGELGLTGEVRRVAYLDQRVGEAVRLGLDQIYAPKSADVRSKNIVPVERLSHVLSALFQ
ncbi:MAG: DNA repair protein RadA [Candidatus Kapabacteria bacterium]|nr:DNA repair protein RadA [Candidatus Kapabacteria bacterium]